MVILRHHTQKLTCTSSGIPLKLSYCHLFHFCISLWKSFLILHCEDILWIQVKSRERCFSSCLMCETKKKFPISDLWIPRYNVCKSTSLIIAVCMDACYVTSYWASLTIESLCLSGSTLERRTWRPEARFLTGTLFFFSMSHAGDKMKKKPSLFLLLSSKLTISLIQSR